MNEFRWKLPSLILVELARPTPIYTTSDIRGEGQKSYIWTGCTCPGGQMSEEQMSRGQKSYTWMKGRYLGGEDV